MRNPAEHRRRPPFAAYALVNFLRPLGKNALGCATGLRERDVLLGAGDRPARLERHSLAEDADTR